MTPLPKHCYLFALEIAPLSVGQVYEELPLHCTLMHRFWTDLSPEQLADHVQEIFAGMSRIDLIVEEKQRLGPKQVTASKLMPTAELIRLHMKLYETLNSLSVTYTAPEWVGEGYTPHATDRVDSQLEAGESHLSGAVYLVEVKVPGLDHKRIIRHRFDLQ